MLVFVLISSPLQEWVLTSTREYNISNFNIIAITMFILKPLAHTSKDRAACVTFALLATFLDHEF